MTNNEIKYASGTIFYNDCKSLERTLESLKDKVDLMICVDGRFKHFKTTTTNNNDSNNLSTDGSRELVLSYDNTILVDVPDSYEIQKRTAYLKWCERVHAEYLLIIDSDEYVYDKETDWLAFDSMVDKTCFSVQYGKYNIFGIYTEVNNPNYEYIIDKITGRDKPAVSQPNKKKWQYHPRLWHNPGDMEYNGTHYMFRHKNPENPLHEQDSNATVCIIPHLKIAHDHLLRSKEFLEARLEYQKWLVPFEQKKVKRFREVFGRLPKDYDEIENWEPISQSEAIRQGFVKIR